MAFQIIKLGGSLLPYGKAIISQLLSFTLRGYSFLVVPGGGPMADLIRDIHARGLVSSEAAHWMAILAMEQYAHLLTDGTGAQLTREVQPYNDLSHEVSVLMPYIRLLEGDEGLEHSWEYTSDSVAAWAAAQLDTDMMKITDVDGVMVEGQRLKEIDASALLDRPSPIDRGALKILISSGRNCRVVNGLDSRSIEDAVLRVRGGTIIWGR